MLGACNCVGVREDICIPEVFLSKKYSLSFHSVPGAELAVSTYVTSFNTYECKIRE